MSWTDERVSTLKQLWTDGLSASQIADRLGGVTRNAVIGKVHRLKLESRGKTSAGAAEPVEAAQAPSVEPFREPRLEVVEETVVSGRFTPAAASTGQSARPHSYGATALKLEPEEDQDFEPAVKSETDAVTGEVVPISRKLTLVQLTERTCKWPVGDPMHSDFHFCGNPSRDASPYCEFHAKLAFQAVERRRVR